MFGKVKIEPIDNCNLYNVYVNDKEIEHCTGVYFQLLPDRIPDIIISLGYTPEYEGDARVRFQYSHDTIDFAKKVIATCLDNDDDLSDELFEAVNNALGKSAYDEDVDKVYDAICEVFKDDKQS